MTTVYFSDKAITFADRAPRGAALLPAAVPDVAKVLQNLEITNSLWVVSPDWEKLFDGFCRQFNVRRAAGGVVENPRGEVLVIFRNGRWDLPKGHMEQGESPEVCAGREVGEECGVVAFARSFVCTTYHTYMLDGRWALKSCDWFAMDCPGGYEPSPQREEGIERAEWVPRAELERRMENSYHTIRNTVRTYLEQGGGN